MFVFVVLPLTALVIAVLLGSLTLHGQAMRMLVGERNARAARAAAAITEQLHHRTTALRSLAVYAQAVDAPAALTAHNFLMADFDGGVALFNLDGQPLAATSAAFDAASLIAQTTTQTPIVFSAPFTVSGTTRVLLAVRAETIIVVGAFAPTTLAERALSDAFAATPRPLWRSSRPMTSPFTRWARRLTPAQEMALYRLAQEAFTNIARYAQARTVPVAAVFSEGAFTLRVQDDGVGFTAPARVSDLVQQGHYGLMGMHERAELIGARLIIDSAPHTGTRIEVHLPL